MNLKKLIEKTESFLNSDERERKQKRKYLKQVIKKLRKHEHGLKEKLEAETDQATREKIEKKIGLAHAHRKKGLKNLKALKKKASKSDNG